MSYSDKPSWCKADKDLCHTGITEDECEGCADYNPKLTFFEAWEKSEEGDKLMNLPWKSDLVTKEAYNTLKYDNGNTVLQSYLFDKTWTIIPKKKTVTIDIPEDAENVCASHKNGKNSYAGHISKITYEIDNTQKP